jgi:hypothetical protein
MSTLVSRYALTLIGLDVQHLYTLQMFALQSRCNLLLAKRFAKNERALQARAWCGRFDPRRIHETGKGRGVETVGKV